MPHEQNVLYLPNVPLGGQPLAAEEAAEARAIKLAFFLAVAILRNDCFMPDRQAVPVDLFDSPSDWLLQQVSPLANQSPAIRDSLVLLDPLSQSSWDTPVRLRRVIQHLRFQTRRLIPPGGRRG